MATEKIFNNVRLALKIDTLENWGKSSLVLKKGEVAFASVAASAGTGLAEPVVMMKIGDGEHTFSELKFDFYAKASDVLAACKTEDGLRTFINGVIADAGIASSDAMEALAKRVTTTEGAIEVLNSAADVEGSVAKSIADAIAALNLADTYAAKEHKHEIADVNGLADAIADAKKAGTDANDALEAYKTANDEAVKANADAIDAIKDHETVDSFADVMAEIAKKQDIVPAETYDAYGAAAQALVDAKAYTDEKNTAMNTRVEALEAIDHDHTNKTVLDGITAEKVAAWDAAEQNAKDHADDLDEAMDLRVQALEAKFGEGEGNVESQIASAVAAEKERAEGVEADLQEAIDAINNTETGILKQAKDYADGKDAAIAAAQKAGDDAQDAVDALADKVGEVPADKTVVQMIADAQTAATYDDTKVKEDIQANADAIALLNNGATVAGSVDYKIAQAVAAIMENPDDTMNSINELVTWINGHAEDALELSNKVTANEQDIAALEGLVGTEKVADQITNAIAAALKVDGVDKYALASDLTAAIARIAAMEAKVATWDAAEKNAKDYADGLNTAMNTRVEALEAVDHEHANKDLLDTYTQTEADLADAVAKKHNHANAAELDKFVDGDKAKLDTAVQTVTAGTGLIATKTGTDVAIAFDDSVTFIFDCGDSGVTA